MNKNTCVICSKEFESKRVGVKFCSGKCRIKSVRDKRNDVVTDKLSVTSVTDNKESVTDNATDKVKDPYPKYTETKRLHAESVKLLNSLTLKEIKERGIWLPNWRKEG